jgi:mono/diheme cytochrome c family protein
MLEGPVHAVLQRSASSAHGSLPAFAVAGALVVTLAGCGGTSGLDRGRAVFRRDCSHCHTLTGHDTHASGGDLAVGDLSIPVLASFVRAMPGRLSRGEVADVAAYVRAVQKREHAK